MNTPNVTPKLLHGDASTVTFPGAQGTIDAVITSPPTDPQIFGVPHPLCPPGLWDLGSTKGPLLFGALHNAVDLLKVGGWLWVRSPWAEEPVIRRTLELHKLRYRTRLVHLYPPERNAVKHPPGRPDLMSSLVTASSVWTGWQKEKVRGSREDRVWLNGNVPPRRPTSVYLETHGGIVGDESVLTAGAMAAFLGPKIGSESTLGIGKKVPVRGPTAIDVARYLVRLCTQPGDRVYDPFSGSASIPIACGLEGRKAVGIEYRLEAHRPAVERVKWWMDQPVLPLELTTWDRKLIGDRATSKSIGIKMPVRLRNHLSSSGCSPAATIRAALSTHYGLPLSSCEYACSPHSVSPSFWAGKTVRVEAALTEALADLFALDPDGHGTAQQALRKYCLTSQ